MPCGWTSRPRESARLGRLDVLAGAEHPPPAERVDDQRRGDVAAVRAHRRVLSAADDLRGLELGRAALLQQQPAELRIVERREGEGQRPAGLARRPACAPAASRRSAGSTPPGRDCAATPWVPRRPRSGARRSRSGRGPARARPSRVARARRSGRRRRRRRSGRRRPLPPEKGRGRLRASWLVPAFPLQYPAANGSHAHSPCHLRSPRRRGLRRDAPRDRRPDRSRTTTPRSFPSKRAMSSPERSYGSTRTKSWSTSDTRAKGSSPTTSSRSASRSIRMRRSSSAKRSTLSSSPRRIRTVA